ncbi:MAG: AzlD domain-containing protein [Spirochaetia bacterium]|nr:AzlD domain-containing protein [Spirochaetia bacterium]
MIRYYLLVIAVMTIVTVFTRAVPFLFFSGRKPPQWLDYLQKFMPPAVMTLLVFNALKDVSFSEAPYGLPALGAALVTALLHLWKRNVLLSIVGGTAVYMLAIRLPF